MTQVERIIDKFGGLSAMAKALGHKHPTTVQGWKDRGVIPAQQQQAVLDKARDLGIELSPADFFEAVEPKREVETDPAEAGKAA